MGKDDLLNSQIDHEAVRFSMGLALENPGDYSIEEMRELIDRHDATQNTLDQAMREDLASMPPEMQEKMKEMLKDSDVPTEVWREIFGEGF